MYKLSRRQLTVSAGAGILLAPFLSMLREGSTRAGTTKQAKRLLVFCTMGTKPDSWTPTQISGETIGAWSTMTQPLSAIKDNVVLVEGCPAGSPGEGHGSNAGITGQGNGYFAVNNVVVPAISVDQFAADKLVKSGIKRPLASLVLGVDTASRVTMSWRGGKAVSPILSPASAFATAFGGVSTGGGTTTPGGGTPATPDAALKRRQSILDLVSKEIGDVKARVGSAEKAKLDAHLTSIRALEDKLSSSSSGSTGGGGGNPNAAQACAGLKKPTDSSKPMDNALLHMDILVNALACDITRVGVMQFGSDQGLNVDIASPALQGEQHNGFIHSGSGDNFQKLIAFENWLATQFANLVTSLKSKPDPDGGGGTLYDSTLVVWARDMGDAVNHDMKNMRFVLAGGAGGYLKQAAGGRYLNAGGTSASRHERVLLNILEAMGVTDYTGFGDPAFSGKSPLSGISAG